MSRGFLQRRGCVPERVAARGRRVRYHPRGPPALRRSPITQSPGPGTGAGPKHAPQIGRSAPVGAGKRVRYRRRTVRPRHGAEVATRLREETAAKRMGRSRTRRLCDGPTLITAFRGAVASLARNVDEVNALNVFPVPDGDTGSNMLATVRSALAEAEALPGGGADARAGGRGAELRRAHGCPRQQRADPLPGPAGHGGGDAGQASGGRRGPRGGAPSRSGDGIRRRRRSRSRGPS